MKNLIAEKEYTAEQKQYMFMSALHHDHRNGKTLLRVISDHEVVMSRFDNNLKKLIATELDGNIYVSVNDFKNEHMMPYCLNAMFFDLDGHNFESKEELESAKQNTMNALNQAVEAGILMRWSVCNDSGRGLQFFYILNRSIKVSVKTKSMVNFFHATYRDMTILLKEILEAYDDVTLSVDDNVRDMQRICRMPETYNLKENARCKCIMKEFNTDENEKFVTYTLNELAVMSGYDGFQKERYRMNAEARKEAVNKRQEIAANKTDEEKELFLHRRMKQLEEIQTYRSNWTGYRQTFCFIYYNTVIQIMSHNDAGSKLEQFNDNFGNGIETKQLCNIISEVKKHGFYKFSSKYIIEALDLSRSEIKRSNILVSSERQERKEKMIDYKTKRDELVVSLICCGQKYESIVDTVNETFKETGKSISLRTVKNIAKRYDCGARNGSVKDTDGIDCYDKSYKKSENENICNDDFFACDESAKNVVYNRVVIKYNNNNVTIDGINFDIETEEDDDDIPDTENTVDVILASGKYDYGLSFLTYLRNNISDSYISVIDTFIHELYACKTETMIHDVMNCVEYLASCYEINPELHVAVFDLESLTRSMRHNKLMLKVHGISVNLKNAVQHHEHPITYIPKKSITDTLQILKQEIIQSISLSDFDTKNMIEKQLDVTITELLHISNYQTKWLTLDNVTVKMPVFKDMIRNLTAMDLLHITDKFLCSNKSHGTMFLVNEVQKTTYRHCNKKDLRTIDKLMKCILPQKEAKALAKKY